MIEDTIDNHDVFRNGQLIRHRRVHRLVEDDGTVYESFIEDDGRTDKIENLLHPRRRLERDWDTLTVAQKLDTVRLLLRNQL